jgi:small subunit ribosomal protein S3
MGQKTHPVAFRLANPKGDLDWQSRWFTSKREYKNLVLEDLKIRQFLEERLEAAGLIMTKIERLPGKVKITLSVSRPGLVIGRGGKGLEELKKQLSQMVSISKPEKNLEIEVEEIRNPELYAKFVAQWIASQLIRRMPYRRVVNRAIERVMGAGAVGIKVVLKGRINGIEISRQEKFSAGKVSSSTIRADIDFAEVPALTRSGYIGVKVYINRGEK